MNDGDKLSPLTAPCARGSEVRVSWQGLTLLRVILKVFNNPRSLKEAGHTHYPTLHHISVLVLHSLNNLLMVFLWLSGFWPLHFFFTLEAVKSQKIKQPSKRIQAQFMDSYSENPAQQSKLSTNFDSREDQNILNMLAHVIIIPHRHPEKSLLTLWSN